MMNKSTFCKGCWCQRHMLMPIRGPLAVPFRVLGVRQSRMNPNICNVCETRFAKIKKTKQVSVPLAILFADIRGYTGVSEVLGSQRLANLLSYWYDRCAPVIWERDGIVNKLMGDAILAVFNFPITRQDYIQQAVLAGIELQKRCQEMRASLGGEGEGKEMSVGMGVGISAGDVSLGEIGEVCTDFTVVGPIVNVAARLQGAASPGEVLFTSEVCQLMGDISPYRVESRLLKLKGIEAPVPACAVHVV